MNECLCAADWTRTLTPTPIQRATVIRIPQIHSELCLRQTRCPFRRLLII